MPVAEISDILNIKYIFLLVKIEGKSCSHIFKKYGNITGASTEFYQECFNLTVTAIEEKLLLLRSTVKFFSIISITSANLSHLDAPSVCKRLPV